MNPDDSTEITAVQTVSAEGIALTRRAYTVDEIANLLQISRSKAYELCRQGLFKTIKVGRAIRVSKFSFDEWLDSQPF